MKFFVLTLLVTLAACQVPPPPPVPGPIRPPVPGPIPPPVPGPIPPPVPGILPIGPIAPSPLVRAPGPYIPNFAPRFAPALFNPFLNPAVNPAIPGMFNTLLQGNIMGGLFGKRSVEEVGNTTLCSYTNVKDILSCRGEKNFECTVTPRLTELNGANVRLSNLTLVPEVVDGVKVYRIVSWEPTTTMVRKWTLVHPVKHENILVSIFSSPKVEGTGLIVEDRECWSKFESVLEDLKPENIRFSFILTKSV